MTALQPSSRYIDRRARAELLGSVGGGVLGAGLALLAAPTRAGGLRLVVGGPDVNRELHRRLQMMSRLIGGLAVLVLSASTAAAQQPGAPAPDRRPGMVGGNQMSTMMMDSLNHRLDSLVNRMNRTSGNQKVQAMAAVINELVTQRKAMQERMHQMMERGGMMGMMNDSTSSGRNPPLSPDTATDTTNHAAHHQPQ